MPRNATDEAAAAPQLPTLPELFRSFLTISTSGFGGVMPWTRRMMVEERGWMSAREFTEAYALCQLMPGPNTINFAVVFGARVRGVAGAAVALAGLLGPPIAVVLVLAALYAQFGELEALRRGLAGVAAAAAGLLIAVAVKMAEPLWRDHFGLGLMLAAAVFGAIGLMRWPLPYVLLGVVPVAIALALRGRL